MASEDCSKTTERRHPCATGCRLFGTPETFNLCSECFIGFREFLHLPPITQTEESVPPRPSASNSTKLYVKNSSKVSMKAVKSKCLCCSKRVGYMGFNCRCGITFCTTLRYPEKHGCEFDFKRMGHDAIAKANPIIMAYKLLVRI